MSQAAPQKSHAHAAHGEDLLRELRQGWKPLPAGTLIAMAMGGLRVRMTRSMVTMLSVVLAIAFLTYSGLSGHLSRNVVLAMVELEKSPSVPPAELEGAAAALLAIDPIASLDESEQRGLARRLRMDDVAAQQAQVITADANRRKALGDRATAEKEGRTLDIHTADAAIAKSEAELRDLESQIAFGRWLASGEPGDAERVRRLGEVLRQRYREVVGSVTNMARASEGDLRTLGEHFLPLAEKGGQTAAADVLRRALEKEGQHRDATEMRKRLKAAGVNVELSIKGDPMDKWLAAMALLTCVVGIANAMLMSVTERFREIGTMKCLGAVDGLVVKLFLIESGFMGVVGGVLGIALGFVVAIVAALLQFGGYGMSNFPIADGVKVVGWAILFGVLLSVLGAAGPAWQASRMKPVDALRVDE